MENNKIERVPIHLKMTLTSKEAAEYSNIGINKIDSIELRRAEQEEPLLRAVGDIDIGSMNDYLIRQRGGFEDGEDL